MKNTNQGEKQKRHYEAIHSEYVFHYFDEYSLKYREKVIFPILLDGIDFNGLNLADLASGSGFNSVAIKKSYPRVILSGFDISKLAVAEYIKVVKSEAYKCDLLKINSLPKNKFDIAIIVGGIHHLTANLPVVIKNIHQSLRPGGMLLIFEPTKDFFLNGIREFWYRLDRYFDQENESALSHDKLAFLARDFFKIDRVSYGGSIGYFLVLNSLVFRIPKLIKNLYSPFLIYIDQLASKFSGKKISPFYIARWVKI